MPKCKSLFSENSMKAHDSQNDIVQDWNMRWVIMTEQSF